MENNKLNIWWKIAIISFALSIIAIPTWICLNIAQGMDMDKLIQAIRLPWICILYALILPPIAYVSVFALWHWRTRYAGKYPLN